MKTLGVILTPAEHSLVLALNDLHISTARQLCRLLRSPGSLTKIQTDLKALTLQGYVARSFVPRADPRGGSTYLYWLTRKGLRHLQSLELETRAQPSDDDTSYYHILHTLDANDFLIAAVKTGLTLGRVYHEYDLKRLLPGPVVPDAWLEILMDRARCIALELDRGHMDQRRWRQKIAAYLEWVRGAYQTQLDSTSLTVAVVTPTASRSEQLRKWTEAELTLTDKVSLGALFCFGSFQLATSHPHDVFTAANYTVPFASEKVGLV